MALLCILTSHIMNLGNQLVINQSQLDREIETLSRISDAKPPAVTRVLFTKADQEARSYVCRLARLADLDIKEDPMGNLFFKWTGTDPQLKPVATGSHIDAIPHSGKYDGVVGVLGAIEALRALKRSGFRPLRSIEIILFTAEEPTRFGIGCIGSRTLCGQLKPEDLMQLVDQQQVPFDLARKRAGYIGDLKKVRLSKNHYQQFIELHIEQGPRLEQEGIDIGLVTAIAAPATLKVSVSGEGGHAGAVMMNKRKDALIPASEIALKVRQIAGQNPSEHGVATVGLFQVFPGAVNSIPSLINMEIDIRDTQLQHRDDMLHQVKTSIREIGEERSVQTEVHILNADIPASCHEPLVDLLEELSSSEGLSSKRLISHAYHDALFMAQVCPTAMIFVPSENGYSHRPEEYTAPQQIAKGVQLLANTLRKLASE